MTPRSLPPDVRAAWRNQMLALVGASLQRRGTRDKSVSVSRAEYSGLASDLPPPNAIEGGASAEDDGRVGERRRRRAREITVFVQRRIVTNDGESFAVTTYARRVAVGSALPL